MRNLRSFSIYPPLYFVVALSLFVLPFQLVFGWIIAAMIHELSHLLMLILLKVKVHSVSVGITGTLIKTEPMSPVKELCCALAGPIGGLLPLVILRITPYVALSAAIQSFYNLLPVYPQDGGRAVKSAATCLFGESAAQKISFILSAAVIILTTLCGCWLSYRYRLGILPIIFPLVPLLRNVRKNSLQRMKKNCRI